MPISAIISLFELAVSAGPSLTADTMALYATIAHGEGGLAKVGAAFASLAKLASDAGAAVEATTAPVVPLTSDGAAQAAAAAQGGGAAQNGG
jgi:hypothetical protein